MKKIKIIASLLIIVLIILFYFNYKHSYYGYTKSYFNQTPNYIRPHFRGSDLGNRGFCIVQSDINLDVIGIHSKTRIKGERSIDFKYLSGYYYTNDNLIVEGIDKNNKNKLVLITPKNFESYVFDSIDSVPQNKGYKHIVIPKGKWNFYITNYLILFSFILVLILIYLLIKERKKRKKS